MSWNYRVMRQKTDEGYWYGIFRVYYDEGGKPEKHSTEPRAIVGENIEEVKWNLDKFKQAFEKPVLEWHEGEGYREVEG